MDLKKPGTRVDAHASCGEIESVKSVSDIYAPVAGEIIETNDTAVNKAINDDSKAITVDPYGAFWLLKLRVAPGTSLDSLMDSGAYEKQIAAEGH